MPATAGTAHALGHGEPVHPRQARLPAGCRAGFPAPVRAARHRPGDPAQPDRVLGTRHGHGGRRPGQRSAHRIPGGAGHRRGRVDRDPGGRRAPDRALYLDGADGRHGCHDPRVHAARGRDPPSRRGRLRAAVPRWPRDHGHGGRHPGRGPCPQRGPHRAVPRHAEGNARPPDPGDPGRVRNGGRAARGGRSRRRGGRRVTRLPPVTVPQPADQPADRRVGRRRDRPAAVPARGARRVSRRDEARLRGGDAHLDRRGDP